MASTSDTGATNLISTDSSLYLIGNIPSSLHSADLRAFFSSLTESEVFTCFHYKHRPEHTKNKEPSKTKCCVVVLRKGIEQEKNFIKDYSDKNWTILNGDTLPMKTRIQPLTVLTEGQSTSSNNGVPRSELQALPELNPPEVMPQGNVGTPLKVFMSLIRNCKLPGHVIKKLKLEFPKARTQRRYGAVRLDYGRDEEDNESIPSDDDHDAEEWERYEALHDDVDKQGRTKERLFEEELEVVWEKGGSGLVFYTDSAYWNEQEGDFDEQCSKEDDWDVGTSHYYSRMSDPPSKDSADLADMTQEKRMRLGLDNDGEHWRTNVGFEKHTKGFGSKVLRASGWREGQGVGVANQGMATPIEPEGQLPTIKKGLGYRGEKLVRHGLKRCHPDRLISTIYDKPRTEEQDTVLRTATRDTMKYRDFKTGGILNPT